MTLLFASTLACTWGRRARTRLLVRGELPPSAVALPARGADVGAFLRERGFRGAGDLRVRHGWALWGGWVLHVGLLVLIAGVLVQQAFQDGGGFELSEGEVGRLSAPGFVVGRERGLLAPASPPDLEVRLERFDPFLHQPGYAPDRMSLISIVRPGEAPRTVRLDRAAGVRAGPVELHQAIPTGLAVNLEVEGLGIRSAHLATESDRLASASLDDPAGRPARLTVSTERRADDPRGTGPLRIELEQESGRLTLEPGVPFRFGGRAARVVAVVRWGRFTWARSPGMPAVLAGFAVILAGCALLAFPAGVARLEPPGTGVAARVFQPRGREVLLAEWGREGT